MNLRLHSRECTAPSAADLTFLTLTPHDLWSVIAFDTTAGTSTFVTVAFTTVLQDFSSVR